MSTQQEQRSESVARDLRNLASYLDDLAMRAVCDTGGHGRARVAVPEIPVVSPKEAEATVAADPSVVWVTGGGHWMGTPAKAALHRTLTRGRLFVIVVRSALSGSYYGTNLYAYDGRIPGHALVCFVGGEIDLDPRRSADERGPR